MKLSKLFSDFFESEKSGGAILILCAFVSILLANSGLQTDYIRVWHFQIQGDTVEHWINDGLMAIFFLLIGLELEREVYSGELSSFKKAALPVISALGGMIVPAAIYLAFNFGKTTQAGAGIPMATDIAFAIGVLSLLGKRIPLSLKIFLTALAVIDDLGAIIVIAVFYTGTLSFMNLGIALIIFAVLLILNRLRVRTLIPYLAGGVVMWYFMLHSGIHASISGVMLAFAIPFGKGEKKSPSIILQSFLHKPVAFFILPLFALANTCIVITGHWQEHLPEPMSIGILCGLIAGKPLGIVLFAFSGVKSGFCQLPGDVKWKQITGVGVLGGIGFTMSVFIALLAFKSAEQINEAKIAIVISSCVASLMGYGWLRMTMPGKEIR